jgi:ATP synthase subunit 6
MNTLTIAHMGHPERPFLLERALDRSHIAIEHFLFKKDEFELFANKIENNFIFVTTNTSFINMYSVFFCFVFIFLIIYLIFNKALSNNSNTIIPNIYQMFGETIYKVSLNLFYSVLGRHLTHPEFFIKINTIFLFLIISNVQGMIPYMSTLTSALTNTFFIALALFISIIITLLDKKGINYFLNLFMPSGCPIFLVLLLIPIEVISYSFRVVSLSVRLFANMMAGHTLLKVIVGFS